MPYIESHLGPNCDRVFLKEYDDVGFCYLTLHYAQKQSDQLEDYQQMHFQRQVSRQNMDVFHNKQMRQHYEVRQMQGTVYGLTNQHTVSTYRQPLGDVQHINNVPYAGVTYVTQPMYQQVHVEEEYITKHRPPSSNMCFRPVVTLSNTPKANVRAQPKQNVSRQRSVDENSQYFSNTLNDISDTQSSRSKVVRKNCLKTVTKPNIPTGRTLQNSSVQKMFQDQKGKQEQQDKLKYKVKELESMTRQRDLLIEQTNNLRAQLMKSKQQKQQLHEAVDSWKQKYEQSQDQLNKAKMVITNYDSDLSKLSHKLSTTTAENSSVLNELEQLRESIPEMLKRFQRLEKMNEDLQRQMEDDSDEWQRDLAKFQRMAW